MKYPNLARRGHLFWWRRKITLHGTTIPIALPLGTANFYHARGIAERLGGALEDLRLTYGQRGSAIDATTLKRVFQDAMRWQLDRILQSQIGSTEPVAAHRQTNRIYSELWRHHANNGSNAQWRMEDQRRLMRSGWCEEDVQLLLDEVDRQSGRLVSLRQLQAYADKFGFELSPANHTRVQQVIFSARAAACEAANDQLGREPGDLSQWTRDALAASDPLIFEVHTNADATAPAPAPAPAPSVRDTDVSMADKPPTSNVVTKPNKLLTTSTEDCIAAFQYEKAWSTNTIEQVRTAIRLFDFACGKNVTIETITRGHVERFRKLCEALPNRWGRTTEEQAGGLSASLARAETMDPSMLGMSQKTRNKHLTWITSVLTFAATDQGGNHEPDDAAGVEKAIRELRRGIGKKGGKSDRKRARDLRAAWTRDEITRLFSAPIWIGCHSLDHRLQPGREIYHDAWYWVPLMAALYGGRSSELVGMPLADVNERAPIPFFDIDYSDLRPLKNVQSVRSLPIHPELIRLGFIDYIAAVRATGHRLLFPEMHSARSKSFASTFYKSVFTSWRDWAFPDGTEWRHQVRGAIKDKDVHSFRGTASTMMKGKVADSVRFDILGHEGTNTTTRSYDEEAPLQDKLDALKLLTPLTAQVVTMPLQLRPEDRQNFGGRTGRKGSAPKT